VGTRSKVLASAAVVLIGLLAWTHPWSPSPKTSIESAGEPPKPLGTTDPAASPTLAAAAPRKPAPIVEANSPRAPIPDAGCVRLFGTVVYPTMEPSAQADVSLSVGGVLLAKTATLADGTFEVCLDRERAALPQPFVVEARDRGGRAAFTDVVLAGGDSGARIGMRHAIGLLVLRDARPLKAIVTTGAGCSSLQAHVSLVWEFAPETICLARVIPIGAESDVGSVPPGNYRLLVEVEGCGDASVPILLEGAEYPIARVHVATGSTISVRVVNERNGAPLAGVRLEVSEYVLWKHGAVDIPWPMYDSEVRTGPDGRAQILVSRPETIIVRASLDGFCPERRSLRPSGAEGDVVLSLAPALVIRWPVGIAEGKAPADGEEVRIIPSDCFRFGPVPRVGRIEGREIVVEVPYRSIQFDALAITETGLVGRLVALRPDGAHAPVAFVRPRTLRTTVTTPSGAPAADHELHLAIGGLIQLAGRTGADGTFRFQDLPADVAYLSHGPVMHSMSMGAVDLRRGDAEVRIIVGEDQVLRVRVRGTEGEVSPTSISISVNGNYGPFLSGNYGLFQWDRNLHAWLVPWRPSYPGETAYVDVRAAGHLAQHKVAAEAEGRSQDLDFVLEQAGEIVLPARVADRKTGTLRLERFDEGDRSWAEAEVSEVKREYSAEATDSRIGPLPRGIYRLTDPATGASTDPITVVPGGEPATVQLDRLWK
jgi:hypothetical protein